MPRALLQLLLAHLLALLPRGSQPFTIEPDYLDENDAVGADRTAFRFGHFAFPEARTTYTGSLANVHAAVAACVGEHHAPYATLKFDTAAGLNPVDVARFTPPHVPDEDLSHALNGCQPAQEGTNNGVKELMYQVALAVWPWNTYAVKNYAYDLEVRLLGLDIQCCPFPFTSRPSLRSGTGT
jgi:hypothetical protein